MHAQLPPIHVKSSFDMLHPASIGSALHKDHALLHTPIASYTCISTNYPYIAEEECQTDCDLHSIMCVNQNAISSLTTADSICTMCTGSPKQHKGQWSVIELSYHLSHKIIIV